MTVASTQGGELQLGAKATGSCSAALDHAQTWTGTERGNSWGMCQPMLGRVAQVGVRVNLKDKSANHCDLPISVSAYPETFLINWRGLCAPSFSRNSHRSAFSPDRRLVRCSSRRTGHHFPAARLCAERGGFHSVRVAACKRVHAHILPVEQVYQGITHRDHVSNLSSSLVSVGIDHNEIGLTHAQAFFAPGAKAND